MAMRQQYHTSTDHTSCHKGIEYGEADPVGVEDGGVHPLKALIPQDWSHLRMEGEWGEQRTRGAS